MLRIRYHDQETVYVCILEVLQKYFMADFFTPKLKLSIGSKMCSSQLVYYNPTLSNLCKGHFLQAKQCQW